MAVQAAEAEELVALAEERELVLMPGHLLLYHPGVRKLKELVDAGELGEVLYLYGNRQNFGKIRRGGERALEPRRPRPLRHPLPRRRGPERVLGARRELPRRGRGCRLLLPPLPVRQGRPHAPLVARPAQEAPDDRRRHEADGRLRRHGARAQDHDLREGRRAVAPRATASGGRGRATSTARASPTTSRSASRCSTSSTSSAAKQRPLATARDGVGVVRALEQLQNSLEQSPRDARRQHRGRLPGHGARGRGRDRRPRGGRGSRRPSAPARPQAAWSCRPLVVGDGTIILACARRLRRQPAGERRHRRRPGLRAGALRARRRRRRRPRLARRERHHRRRAHDHPGERLRDRVLDARGGRLHRALRRHDERQLHGPHRGAACAPQGADHPARRPRGRRRRAPARDRDRGGGVRRRRRRRARRRSGAGGRRREPGAPDPPGSETELL